MLTAINTCGYDQDLDVSDPLRSRVRSEVARARQSRRKPRDATQAMCQYYQEHQQPDAIKALAQYVSLALYLNPPPALTAKVKDADMPPDAAAGAGNPAADAKILRDQWVCMPSGKATAQAYAASDRALSRSAGQDVVRHRDLSEAAVVRPPGPGVHGVYRSHGRAGTNQCPELRIGLLCGDFSGPRRGAQDGADPAYLPALPAGSAGHEVSGDDEDVWSLCSDTSSRRPWIKASRATSRCW